MFSTTPDPKFNYSGDYLRDQLKKYMDKHSDDFSEKMINSFKHSLDLGFTARWIIGMLLSETPAPPLNPAVTFMHHPPRDDIATYNHAIEKINQWDGESGLEYNSRWLLRTLIYQLYYFAHPEVTSRAGKGELDKMAYCSSGHFLTNTSKFAVCVNQEKLVTLLEIIRNSNSKIGLIYAKQYLGLYKNYFYNPKIKSGWVETKNSQELAEKIFQAIELKRSAVMMIRLFSRTGEKSNFPLPKTILRELKCEEDEAVDIKTYRAIHAAASVGCEDSLRYWLHQTLHINVKDHFGDTALSLASWKGYYNLVRILLEKKADLNIPANDGKTPLLAAVSRGHLSVARLLLDNKAVANQLSKESEIPLVNAAALDDTPMVQLLLEYKANVNAKTENDVTALRWTVKHQNPIMAEILLAAGANPSYGFVLMHAAATGAESIVRTLLETKYQKAKVDETNNSSTPLNYAAEYGFSSIVKLLLDEKASVNNANSNNGTPLFSAVNNNHFACAELLLKASADVNIATKKNTTPIDKALRNNNEAIVKLLCAHGAKVPSQASPNLCQDHLNYQFEHLARKYKTQYDIPNRIFMVFKENEGCCSGYAVRMLVANILDKYHKSTHPYGKANLMSTLSILSRWNKADLYEKDRKWLLFMFYQIFFYQSPHESMIANQDSLEKFIIDEKGPVLKKVFSLAGCFTQEQLEKIFEKYPQLLQNTYICANSHATTAHEFKYFYDANHSDGEIIIPDAKKIAKEIFAKHFFEDKKPSPIAFLVFQHRDENQSFSISAYNILQEFKCADNHDHHYARGYTSLHVSAKHCADSLRYWLEQKGDINKKSKQDITPLFLAAQNGNETSLNLLLAAKANPDLSDDEFNSPLLITAKYGFNNCVISLLKAKANPNHDNKYGSTVLMQAAMSGHDNVVKTLLKAKAEPNLTNTSGSAALYAASAYGNLSCVQTLIQAKANVNAINVKKSSALLAATENGYQEITKTLLFANADPNLSVNQFGSTPLMFAVTQGNFAIAQLLIAHEANALAVEDRKLTPLNFTQDKKITALVKITMKLQELMRTPDGTISYLHGAFFEDPIQPAARALHLVITGQCAPDILKPHESALLSKPLDAIYKTYTDDLASEDLLFRVSL